MTNSFISDGTKLNSYKYRLGILTREVCSDRVWLEVGRSFVGLFSRVEMNGFVGMLGTSTNGLEVAEMRDDGQGAVQAVEMLLSRHHHQS